MLKKIVISASIGAVVAVGISACHTSNASASKKEVSESEAYATYQKKGTDGKHFGEKITSKGAISYDAMLSKMAKAEKLDEVKVVGKVEAVCKAKGCWMNIQSESGQPSMFVKFQDYAFFMPKDIVGKKVVMLGSAFKETTSIEDLRHFAEDEGKSKEEIAKINKPREEMNFMATSYKVKEGDFGRFLNFLTRNGYNTGLDEEGNVFINVNRGFTGGNSGSPSVYIDNDLVLDNNLLFNLYMNEIDEIYMDKSGNSDVTAVGNGTIKIFLRQQNNKKEYYDIKYTSLIVKKGFTKNINFKNSQFETQNEFYYFGTLNWSPNISIKDNPNYEIKFPKGNQKEIQVLLEGFSEDGQLVSEIRKIPVSNL